MFNENTVEYLDTLLLVVQDSLEVGNLPSEQYAPILELMGEMVSALRKETDGAE